MANKKIAQNLVRQLRSYLLKIEKLRSKINSWQQFQEDWENEWKIERGLQLIIECCIDIGKEIIAGKVDCFVKTAIVDNFICKNKSER